MTNQAHAYRQATYQRNGIDRTHRVARGGTPADRALRIEGQSTRDHPRRLGVCFEWYELGRTEVHTQCFVVVFSDAS